MLKNHIGGQYPDYPCSSTLDAASQLDRDASIALATIREWRNSFVRFNRIPADILSLIATNLSSQADRFHAASVSRRWRGVLLNRGTLWSQLFLIKGEEYASTLLGRAKGSLLDIITHHDAPLGTTTLILPHVQQIKHLEFIENSWQDVVMFSGANSGQLPLLRTLKIIDPNLYHLRNELDIVTAPSPPIFRSSIDLEEFVIRSGRLSLLSCFLFPNLTTFELSSGPEHELTASYLLDFLKASPTLQTVDVEIPVTVELMSVAQETIVVLPNVKTFSLRVADSLGTRIYDVAARISCPFAKYTSLTHHTYEYYVSADLEVFTTPVLWNTILHQYTASPIERVNLEMNYCEDKDIYCHLTFRSSDATVVDLNFEVPSLGLDEAELHMPRAEMRWMIFAQALKTIQYHPLLSHVKQLHIENRAAMSDADEMLRAAEQLPILFSLLGPLDKLTISGCDLHMFIDAFLDCPRLRNSKPIVFPHIETLVILYPLIDIDETECLEAIVELAKLQHSLGIPFRCVKVRLWTLFPAGMAGELGRWVNAVDCDQEDDV
ncbi:hypothetical protein BJ322DRAFT_1109724 [Thelephora terrestris]|uniref:F-box domain-containing protein n=1 Tax=Thelephora terrestris TaxID=56493 RepID=A0A9P6HC53_9AGAM|nr:hypothetical protein BJ322DRAFT_1109724 [Thelephora terrestris]